MEALRQAADQASRAYSISLRRPFLAVSHTLIRQAPSPHIRQWRVDQMFDDIEYIVKDLKVAA